MTEPGHNMILFVLLKYHTGCYRKKRVEAGRPIRKFLNKSRGGGRRSDEGK
jgi:hypothetical protein